MIVVFILDGKDAEGAIEDLNVVHEQVDWIVCDKFPHLHQHSICTLQS